MDYGFDWLFIRYQWPRIGWNLRMCYRNMLMCIRITLLLHIITSSVQHITSSLLLHHHQKFTILIKTLKYVAKQLSHKQWKNQDLPYTHFIHISLCVCHILVATLIFSLHVNFFWGKIVLAQLHRLTRTTKVVVLVIDYVLTSDRLASPLGFIQKMFLLTSYIYSPDLWWGKYQ